MDLRFFSKRWLSLFRLPPCIFKESVSKMISVCGVKVCTQTLSFTKITRCIERSPGTDGLLMMRLPWKRTQRQTVRMVAFSERTRRNSRMVLVERSPRSRRLKLTVMDFGQVPTDRNCVGNHQLPRPAFEIWHP